MTPNPASLRERGEADGFPCPACSSPTGQRIAALYDDRYGYPGRFALRSCPSCGHLHVPAKFAPEEIGELYTRFYPRGSFAVEAFEAYREAAGIGAWLGGERASAFRWVPERVRVLDIGCGIGATLAYHRNRGCEAVGVEADRNVAPIAARYGLDIRIGTFDATMFPPASFDYVTLDQVAEHAVDPHALLGGVATVLRSGGAAILTTPNPEGLGARLYGRLWLNWHVPYHLQFYTRRSLALVATRAGLRVETIASVTASEWQYYQWQHLLTFPEPGTRSSFWSSGEPRPGFRRSLRRLAALTHRLRLHQAMSRVLDAAGLGDNRVFVLRKA